MKCLSFNCRGLALKRLITSQPIDNILLQETLGPADSISTALSAIAPGWLFSALDSSGRSGGLAIGYNPTTIKALGIWGGQGFLGLDLFSADLGTNLRVINIYGPCQQRESFWNRLLSLHILSAENIVIGGDLNFSLGYCESWGSSAQIEPITGYMTDLLAHHDLIDVPMNKILPTWRNRRIGEAALARRLDRFIMKGSMFRQLSGPKKKPKAPIKFNHGWLQDPAYNKLVKDFWAQNPIYRADTLAKGFCMNLSQLKHSTIEWARQKNKQDNIALAQIEVDILSLIDERGLGFNSAEDKAPLVELEFQKQKILKEQEESIRLKSKATWLKAGDENTRFFHSYAKGRKVKNTIWSLPTPDGDVADTFPKPAQLGSSHFRNLYKQPQAASITEIINIAGHFPRFVNEDEAEHLFDLLTPKELENTIKWFKKDWSPGPDGWTIEFYIAFYELISNDLLRVIEECRETGTMYNAINSTFIALIPKSDSPSSFDDYRPIPLCNVLYKIISKIIANRIRPILS
eukprot:PITA_23209